MLDIATLGKNSGWAVVRRMAKVHLHLQLSAS